MLHEEGRQLVGEGILAGCCSTGDRAPEGSAERGELVDTLDLLALTLVLVTTMVRGRADTNCQAWFTILPDAAVSDSLAQRAVGKEQATGGS